MQNMIETFAKTPSIIENCKEMLDVGAFNFSLNMFTVCVFAPVFVTSCIILPIVVKAQNYFLRWQIHTLYTFVSVLGNAV